jgi:REP element-mobilizing transposase RayT
MPLYHINFHTLGRRPIFEHEGYDQMLRKCLPAVIERREIVCLAWEIMPTHVHLLIEDFADYARSLILQHVKGDTSRAFFQVFPECREDLLGGHLWAKGYFKVLVRTHRQCADTIRYIRANREHADLPPPTLLEPGDD